jgi:hypothetical protein
LYFFSGREINFELIENQGFFLKIKKKFQQPH